jgi:hypothetical protein
MRPWHGSEPESPFSTLVTLLAPAFRPSLPPLVIPAEAGIHNEISEKKLKTRHATVLDV